MEGVLREVRLYGELGQRFGRVHRLAVASAAEAARALCAVLPGFRAAFLGADGQAGYHVYVGRGAGRECIDAERKEDPVGGGAPIRFVPLVAGSKRQGLGQLILGSVLVVAGMAIKALAWSAGIGGSAMYTAGMYVSKLGWAMVVGGVVQMLAPQRKAPERPENSPSYGMDAGAFNNDDPSAPVPLAYGRVVIGSVRVSAGLTTDAYGVGSGGTLSPQPLPGYMPTYEVDAGASSFHTQMARQP